MVRSLVVVSALVAALPASLLAPVAGATPEESVHSVLESVPLMSASAVPNSRDTDVREITGKRFAMVALRGKTRAPEGAQVQAKRLDGRWGDWLPLAKADDERAGNATEPVWVGDSTALRVRTVDPAGVSVVVIDPGSRPADAKRSTTLASGTGRPAVISRADWGADERIRTDCFARQGIGVEYSATTKAATIHHDAGSNDYSPADAARIVRGIYAFHAQDRDWCDIGYNALVDKYGQIFEGRVGGLEVPVLGAHAGGFNRYTFGVSMLGNLNTAAPSPAQLDSVSAIVAWKLAGSYRDPNSQVRLVSTGGGTAKYPAGTEVALPAIFGHRDVGNTECPGELGYQQLPAIRQRVTERMGDWTSSPIYRKWQATGADAGELQGAFRLESDATNGGRWASFAGGAKSVYWSPTTGAQIVWGNIRVKWTELGAETGILGYPTTDELPAANGGRYNDFQGLGGAIYWTPATGAHQIMGAIRWKWAKLDAERGALGYPLTDEMVTADGLGRYNHFQGMYSSIYWTAATGPQEVRGLIKQRWADLGWERSYLGYPVTDEYSVPGGRRSDFQHGYITWDASTGQVVDSRT
ncbi:N-acetylmuramoyl-L-alanine amidase [Actinocrispum wychmicini]|uniref:LGFP repeat-containing protein n=1 Tax=Actinocrispum wychmicini TaxID=1213861 RepID=A0A4R2JAV6_9PSEU|nr:N-acetylmuramoyl-L-alanine amidase [Actinocrispum wychmicini]TCO55924.1 LGFP repeat-containing protein [Actinocrispum wychmicini]